MRVLFLSRWKLNPYQALLLGELRKLGVDAVERDLDSDTLYDTIAAVKPDVIHLQNIHPGIRGLVPYAHALLDAKRRRIPIVWTVHELMSNSARFGLRDRMASAFTARAADALIVHCDRARAELARHARKVVTMPLGHYRDWYPNRVTRAEARAALGIGEESFVFLFFGWIRAYKGVDTLIDAFARLGREDARLVIAGSGDTPRSSHPGIVFRRGPIADEDVQLFMNACDVVALPYRRILTSGAAVLAMSFGRACIASRVGCLPEVLGEEGAFLYEGDGLLAAMQRAIAARERLEEMGRHNLARALRWRWDEIAEETAEVYRRVMRSDRGAAAR
jgi:beta-1,4-mannosyltransferase